MPAVGGAEQVVVHGFWRDEDGAAVTDPITLEAVPLTGQGTVPNIKDQTAHQWVRTKKRTISADATTGYFAALALASADPDVDPYGGRKVTFTGYDPYVVAIPYNAPTYTVDAKMAAAIPTLTVGDTVRALWLVDAPDGSTPPQPISSYYTAIQTNSLVEQYTWKPRGAYAAGTAYVLRDVVTYQGGAWIAQGSSTGVMPGSDSTKWLQLLVGASVAGAPKLAAVGPFTSASHTPASGEYVIYNPSAAIAPSLPVAAVDQRFGVVNVGTANVTLSRQGSDAFADGSTSLMLAPGDRAVVIGAAGGFTIESRYIAPANLPLSAADTAALAGKAPLLTENPTVRTSAYTSASREISRLSTAGGSSVPLTGPSDGSPFGARWTAGTVAPTLVAPVVGGTQYTINGQASVTLPLAPTGTSNELVALSVTPGTTDYAFGPGHKGQGALAAAFLDPNNVGYDLILLLGQSNMSGSAGSGSDFDAVRYDPVPARVQQFGNSGAYANVISQAVDPLAQHDTPTGMGPGTHFARWYLDTVPANRRVLLVPCAHATTGFEAGTQRWQVGYTPSTNNLYENAITQATAALAAAGANARIVAALWVQGEYDGDASVTATTYATDLDALINGLRTRLGISDLPFVIGQMVPDYLGTGTRAAISNAQAATASRPSRTRFAQGPFGLTKGDGNHYAAAGQRRLARAMFDAYRRIITGTADPAMPSVPGQTVGLSASTPGSGIVALSWTATSGAQGYYVEYKLTADSTWTRAGTPTTNALSITALTNGSSYDFRVTPLAASGPGTASAVLSATPAGSSFYSADTFGRADSSSLGTTETGGLAWAYDSGTWSIVSGKLQCVTAGYSLCCVDDGASDGTLSLTLSTLTAEGLAFRMNAALTQGYVFWKNGTSYYLNRQTASGTFSYLANTSGVTPAAGDVLSVVLSGASIICKVNGSQVLSVSNSSYTGTKHGAFAYNTTAQFDNFAHSNATT